MSNKILVVDDEISILKIIAFNLKKEGFDVVCAEDGQEALDLFNSENPELILLDVMMPKIDGYGVCKEIRKVSQVPIIMLTARADEMDKVLGLDLGADDYVTKPFSNKELMARVKANIRRNSKQVEETNSKFNIVEENNSYSLIYNNNATNISNLSEIPQKIYGDLLIDFKKQEVYKRKVLINLTARDFELLIFLSLNQNEIFTREQLLSKVWGYEYIGDIRSVDVGIRRLREKIEDDASKPRYILTKRGTGYYFCFEKDLKTKRIKD